MVKANSLLYAIYICLLVSLVCAAMLSYFNLYGQLNTHYNLREELFIGNQSLVNFALGSQSAVGELPPETDSGISGTYQSKPYGLLTLLLAQSFVQTDTVASAHFVGRYASGKTAVYLANFSRELSFSGEVKLIGDLVLPTDYILPQHIGGGMNRLVQKGDKSISKMMLPEINPDVKKLFTALKGEQSAVAGLEKIADSLYYNSFFNPTKEILLDRSVIGRRIFKGNFILRAKDSIVVSRDAVLEDVILLAPKITFETGFSGNVQAFATTGIDVGEKVQLNYPSVICLWNDTKDESKIRIKKQAQITGAVVIFGNGLEEINKNSIVQEQESLVTGDVYCSGTFTLKGKVHGSVYTNRFLYKNASTQYENLIVDAEIDNSLRPPGFIGIPLFNEQTAEYGLLKKVL